MAYVINSPGLPSTETFGTPTVLVQPVNDFAALLAADMSVVFFNPDEWAESITYVHHSSQTSTNYNVIVDMPVKDVSLPDSGAVALSYVSVLIATGQLIEAVHPQDAITLRGRHYNIAYHVDDGVGITTLFLTLAVMRRR